MLGTVRKSQPSAQDVHVDAILQDIAIRYQNDPANFIAGQVFPVVPVAKQTNKYFKYSKNDWFRDEAKLRGESEESAGSGYTLATDSYTCDVFAFHKDVAWRIQQQSDNPLRPDQDATQLVMQRLMLRQEIQWATDYWTTGIWATDKVGTTDFVKWNDYAGSDPIDDIEAGKQSMLFTTGIMPNTLVLGWLCWRRLKQHPDIRSQVIPGDRVITPARLAELLEIDRIIIAKAMKATNVEGGTAAYAAAVTNDSALLCYAAPAPSITTPSAGYTFAWRGVSGDEGVTGATVGVTRVPIPIKRTDRIEGEIAFDHKVVATDLGYFFSDAVD